MALLPPIVNPGVPYVGPIDRGFTPGEMVRIQGLTQPNTDRFTINLQCGSSTDPSVDIAMHVSVRVSENYLVLNSKENGQWGKEQVPNTPLPIGLGQHFEILLLCDDNDYKVAVNGQHFGEYLHRLDRNRVSHLSIKGNVEISLICYEGGTPVLPEKSEDAGVTFAETPNKGDDLSIDDFKPTAPLNPVYPKLPQGDGFGAPPGYGQPNQGYGPPAGQGYGPPSGQGYGPPSGQGYGPPSGQGYGPPQGQGYGGPGYGPQNPQTEKHGPFESILGQAGSAIADAISTGAIRSILGGPNQPPQHGPIGGGYPGYQGPGGGPLSNLLSSLTSGGGGQQGGGQGGILGGALGGLLSSALSQPPQGPQGPHQGPQGPYQGQGGGQSDGQSGGLGGFLSGALSSLTSGQNQRY